MGFSYGKDADNRVIATWEHPDFGTIRAKRSATDSTWEILESTGLTGRVPTVTDRLRYILEAGRPAVITPPLPTPVPPTPALPPGKFPALPAGAVLQVREDFERYALGYAIANQCLAYRNKVLDSKTVVDKSDLGKVWYCSSEVGDPAVAAHANRCEFGQWGSVGAGDYIWREVFSVPSDSYLPGGGWQYRAQIHGANPSTSPPIGIWVRQGSSSNKVAVSFQSGDSRIYHTEAIEVLKDSWIFAQFRMRFSGTKAWGEYYVNGTKPAYKTNTANGVDGKGNFDLTKISQGAPSEVYLKFGIDGSPGHGHVALAEQWKVG